MILGLVDLLLGLTNLGFYAYGHHHGYNLIIGVFAAWAGAICFSVACARKL